MSKILDIKHRLEFIAPDDVEAISELRDALVQLCDVLYSMQYDLGEAARIARRADGVTRRF